MWGKFLAAVICLSALVAGAELPAGTRLEIRLKTKVASNSSKAQDPIEAVLIAPVVIEGQVILPQGTLIRGQVAKAQPIEKADTRAFLELAFSKLVDTAGKETKMETTVVGVDNAREKVENGRITGILASETLSARIGQGVEKVEKKSSGLGEFLGAIKQAVLKEPDPEIVYEPGVEMTLEVTKPVALDSKAVWAPPAKLENIEPEEALYELVNAQPFQTVAEKPPKPSDLTTLMFLGSQEQLQAAFKAAGWASAAQLQAASGLETFRAIAEMRGYKEAPVSTLLLDGNKPDLVFQKQNNTFAMRHHLRIWRRPDTFQGQAVWVCAATQDIGIEFSPENRTFIHKIDPQIDRERAKVVNDLLYGGHAAGVALVERAGVPTSSQNATGDKLETDGKMVVLLLK
jgi:hypothetical protein